jgi:hypothetical protein
MPDDTDTGIAHESASISIMLGERPPEIDVIADQNSTGRAGLRPRNLEERELSPVEERLGMMISDLEPNIASELEYRVADGGIVILGVLRDGVAAQTIGFIPGTIIRSVNLRPVNSVEEFAALIARFQPGAAAVFDLRAPGDISLRVAMEIPE